MLTRWKLLWVFMIAVLLLGIQARAEEEQPWALVMPPQPTDHPNKIVVYELFWYACPHCGGILPYLEAWHKKQPDDVVLVTLPAVFSHGHYNHFAKTYFTAEALGVLQQAHSALFHEYHVKKNRLASLEEVAEFFTRFGVDKEKFKKTYNSFGVDMKMRQAEKMTRDFAINGVPSLIVNGKYRLVSSRINGYDEMFKVVDQLVEMERQAMHAKAEPAQPK